jgi:CBS domain-containing protein
MKIADILASKGSKVITIRPHQTIKNAIDMLENHNIGGLVVVDSGENIVGIITERDLIRFAASDHPDFTVSVGEVMTSSVIIGVPQDDINAVAFTMTEKRFRHLPVVEGGRLVGIVTIGDLVKAQRDRYEGEIHTLRIQIIKEEEGV